MNWLRVISRVSLLGAGVLPIVYYFYFFIFDLGWEPKDWDWSGEVLIFMSLLIALLTCAWKYTVACGVISLFAVSLWLLFEIVYLAEGYSSPFDYYDNFHEHLIAAEWFLLIIGGILSLIWDAKRSKSVPQGKP